MPVGLYISNQKNPIDFFIRGIKGLEIEDIVFPSFHSEYRLFQSIESKQPDVIILNSFLKFSNRTAESFSGISFLFYLRMLGFKGHCIVFGQDDLNQIIKQRVSNAYLLAEGNSYVIPYQTKLEEPIRAEVLQKPANNINLPTIIKGNLDFEKVRHEWANYWGIYRLFEAHQRFDKKFSAKKLEELLPENLKKKLFSYEGVALQYLFNQEKLVNSRDTLQLINSCNSIRLNLKASKPKILYVDDQSNFGWSEILQEIIYGKQEQSFFKAINPASNFNEDRLIEYLCNEVIRFEPHLILLDVRLRNEKGFTSNPDELSGLRLLAKIREILPTVPVIMFTASNKAKTIVRCKELGAYEVWTKEGIDERLSFEDSLIHYSEFVRLLYNCVLYVSERANKFLLGLEFPLAQFERKAKKVRFQKWLDQLSQTQKFKTLLFNQFDTCVLDTNIFLYNKTSTINYYKSLVCLFGVRKVSGKNVTILNATYNEMIKWGKYYYNKLNNKDDKDLRIRTARFALPKLQEYNDRKWIFVNGLVSDYNAKSYADPEFATLINESMKKSESVLFICNDRNLRTGIFNDIISGLSTEKKKKYRLMSGHEMLESFKPIVKLIETLE